jgi:hypothetical protein
LILDHPGQSEGSRVRGPGIKLSRNQTATLVVGLLDMTDEDARGGKWISPLAGKKQGARSRNDEDFLLHMRPNPIGA